MTADNLTPKLLENNEDTESTLTFLKGILSHEIDKSIWEWEFNSFPNAVVLTIIKDKDVTVGTQFMLPVGLKIKEIDCLSGKCENSYFHDRYRGLGLFQKLFWFAEKVSEEKKMEILWAFTPALGVYEKKLNFMVFSDAIYSMSAIIGKPRISFIKSFTSNNYKVYLKYIYGWLKWIVFSSKYLSFKIRTKYSKEIGNYSVVNYPETFDDINNLYKKLKNQHDDFIHINIDKSYYEWRIKYNVNLNYSTKFFYFNDELVGYYILSLKGFSANISDFTPSNTRVSKVMMGYLLSETSKLKVVELNYFGNLKNELNLNNFNLLRKFNGKIERVDEMPFVYKDISNGNIKNSFLKSPKNWYLNGLWTEGFRY